VLPPPRSAAAERASPVPTGEAETRAAHARCCERASPVPTREAYALSASTGTAKTVSAPAVTSPSRPATLGRMWAA